jgi:imidazolonepropionase-like amidohydrolase
MHAHVWPPAELDLLLANGVTLVREMFGYGVHLALREDVGEGRRAGPRLIVASPIFEGTPPPEHAEVIVTRDRIIVDDSASAAAAVVAQIARGYDLIKVYNNLSTSAYRGIVAASRAQGIHVGGHVPFAVGLRGVLAAGQRTIEHLRGYVLEAVPASAPDQPMADYRSRLVSWRHADTTVLRALAEATARAAAWNVPTLVTMLTLLPPERIHELTDRPGWRRCMRGRRADPVASRRTIPYFSVMSDEDFRATQEGVRIQKQFVRMLHESGAPLLVGTDMSPVGYAFHWELEQLVDAGIPPWDVLRAATLGAAEYLGEDDRFGTVGEGKQAELVLLGGNPLENIRHTTEIEAVYSRGRLINAAELDSMLTAACDALNAGAG